MVQITCSGFQSTIGKDFKSSLAEELSSVTLDVGKRRLARLRAEERYLHTGFGVVRERGRDRRRDTLTFLEPALKIRRAVPADAAGIAGVLTAIAAERIHSAIDRAWTVGEERRHLESLSPREAFHVAVDAARGIVGLQSLELWSPLFESMAHVGQVGTFVCREWRGRGVGGQLWKATAPFARDAAYRKLVIQGRGSNTAAQAFYRRLGFQDCGRLRGQVIIDGLEDDEVLMELFVV